MKVVLSSFLSVVIFFITSVAMAEITPLVDVKWVKENACKSGIVVLDIRNKVDGGTKKDYLKSHIPCAVYTDYKKAGWRKKVNNVPGMLPAKASLEKLIGGLGVSNNTHVVIYHAGKDSRDFGSATRMYWTFKVLGHDKVSVLNGGFAAYKNSKNKLEKGDVKPKPAKFVAHMRNEMLVDKSDVLDAMKDDVVSLIDVRPTPQFLGIHKHKKTKKGGTIPGAHNLPGSWLTQNGKGKLISLEKLNQVYQYADIPLGGEEIAFCNTGHRASVAWFVSSELMGNKFAKLYDGSMADWTLDSKMPMDKKFNY